MPASPPLSVRSLLETVALRARLLTLARHLQLSVPHKATRRELFAALLRSDRLDLRILVGWLSREELQLACKVHGIASTERSSRRDLRSRILHEAGVAFSVETPQETDASTQASIARPPQQGEIAVVRGRQYLVKAVLPKAEDEDTTRVDLVCIEDDAEGQRLSVLWEIELGARVHRPETEGLGHPKALDPPDYFAAYLNALQWNRVTATRADLFQSPFRAGIKLLDHQLTPLKKALELPRANLFIADDVGLGKTIEAGLIIEELRLRRRVTYVLVVCPAALCLQWRSEMERRFGLRFEIIGQRFVARLRRERGYGVNPWSTHSAFIVSYQTLRRPEYREPLLAHLGGRLSKSMLVLDEAHTVAPASASQYAIDSELTRMVQGELCPRFENRLFLSATPHNGHSNSFSALMAMLDPHRFTRGVPIEAGSASLSAVMVRRLKQDLLALGQRDFPIRSIIRVALDRTEGTYRARFFEATPQTPERLSREVQLGSKKAPEVELSDLLATYTTRLRSQRGRDQIVFVHLQKRLLSSIDAFHRTLSAHAAGLEAGQGSRQPPPEAGVEASDDEDEYGTDDELRDETDASEVTRRTAALPALDPESRELLDRMLALAEAHRSVPDAKVTALLHWLRRELCGAIRVPGCDSPAADGRYADRRVIVFTEYGDTMRYLERTLGLALAETDRGPERIAVFHGGMGDEARDERSRAFTAPPEASPLRILIATDAAREGLNLQLHCADLFHFDIPWNPARMEQRNGRIDRMGQPQPEVRCYYFVYSERLEDRVLQQLVSKVETIQAELGTASEVVMERFERALARGIDQKTMGAIEDAAKLPHTVEVGKRELESQRLELAALAREIRRAHTIATRSRALLAFHEDGLRHAVDVGLELACGSRLVPLPEQVEGREAFRLPTLPATWVTTLDSLRRSRRRDEPEWAWRRDPLHPVVFHAYDHMGDDRVHLHLEHPLVQRILAQLLAQSAGGQALARVTVVAEEQATEARAIAIGRLSLFGHEASRLHDELIAVSAPYRETGYGDQLGPLETECDGGTTARLADLLLRAHAAPPLPEELRKVLTKNASSDFAVLWPHVREEAEARAQQARELLHARGEREADDLRNILRAQRTRIEKELFAQLPLFTPSPSEVSRALRAQVESEREEMRHRLAQIEEDLRREPEALHALYRVSLERLLPIGLVYVWPTSRLNPRPGDTRRIGAGDP